MKYIITEEQTSRLAKFMQSKLYEEFGNSEYVRSIKVIPIDPEEEPEIECRFDILIGLNYDKMIRLSSSEINKYVRPLVNQVGNYIINMFPLNDDEIYVTTFADKGDQKIGYFIPQDLK